MGSWRSGKLTNGNWRSGTWRSGKKPNLGVGACIGTLEAFKHYICASAHPQCWAVSAHARVLAQAIWNQEFVIPQLLTVSSMVIKSTLTMAQLRWPQCRSPLHWVHDNNQLVYCLFKLKGLCTLVHMLLEYQAMTCLCCLHHLAYNTWTTGLIVVSTMSLKVVMSSPEVCVSAMTNFCWFNLISLSLACFPSVEWQTQF